MHIATTDGVKSLTMQRLATDLGCAVGTVYTYFPSKGALIAELQREAVERLAASYRLIRVRSDAELASWNDERAESIARLVVFGRFWIATVDTFPEEAKLLHLLISEPEVLVPPEEQHRVLPVAMALLGQAQACVEHAASVGGIQVSDSLAVVIRWAAALTGALQISNLARLDPVTFDGPRLARAAPRRPAPGLDGRSDAGREGGRARRRAGRRWTPGPTDRRRPGVRPSAVIGGRGRRRVELTSRGPAPSTSGIGDRCG